jgi:hypothetical protein
MEKNQMKYIINILIVLFAFTGFVNCASTTAIADDSEISVDTIKKDFERCSELYGSERDECQDELLKDYARTYNTKPVILERTVLFQTDKYETVKYVIAKHKVVITLEIQERRINIIGDTQVVPFGMGFLVGVLVMVFF